jgi:hypothetical protein
MLKSFLSTFIFDTLETIIYAETLLMDVGTYEFNFSIITLLKHVWTCLWLDSNLVLCIKLRMLS